MRARLRRTLPYAVLAPVRRGGARGRWVGENMALRHDLSMPSDPPPSDLQLSDLPPSEPQLPHPPRSGRHRSTPPGSTARPLVRWVALVAVLAWFGIASVGGPLVGRLSEVQQNDSSGFLPKSAESTRVANFTARLSDTTTLPYLVVIARNTGGLRAADTGAVATWVGGIPALALPSDRTRTVGEFLSVAPRAAVPSADRAAFLVPVTVVRDRASDVVGGKTVLFEVAQALRDSAATTLGTSGLEVHVTGPGGFFADFVTAFGGIDGILLLVALGVVFVILLIVYKSPILPFAVLITAVFGLATAALVIFPLAKNGNLPLSGQSQGILSILVVGAATDYSLLLVARYREELHDSESPWEAMKSAWRAAIEPIGASAATVIIGLLCLRLSDLGSTKGLGPVGALGIAGAFVASLTFLPAVLLLIGRRVFWPRIPRVDHAHAEDALGRHGLWGRVAGLVGSHPRRTWVVTFLALAACAAFVPTLSAKGVTQSDLFLTTVDSVTGQRALAQHFPAGSGSPVVILTPQAKAQEVVDLVKTVPGVADPVVGETPGRPPTVVDGFVEVQATLVAAADSVAAQGTIETLRSRLDGVGTEVLVGGTTASNLDVRDASERDLRVIIPTILGVIFVVLALLLRSLVAPVLLVLANVLSFAATIGVSALVFNHVFHFPGSDPSTPLYGFVFLVALGIDYSIFLMTRVREEAPRRGTRPGILVGLAVTGGVITSAGVVLAATFSALAVLPILFLVQIAFIVAFGVLLDTLVVRSLLVPALAHDIGGRIWWPSQLGREQDQTSDAPAAPVG
ncbi:MMPL family transporter [Lapillicoccus sp.]|uniref:MMPL family transporter n=1 Tax=Lapillicoccus sp. TaxID=1909287 RepID=UPI0025CFAAE1|nr:MMPL family transporter [Lapillicoccus sp.]